MASCPFCSWLVKLPSSDDVMSSNLHHLANIWLSYTSIDWDVKSFYKIMKVFLENLRDCGGGSTICGSLRSGVDFLFPKLGWYAAIHVSVLEVYEALTGTLSIRCIDTRKLEGLRPIRCLLFNAIYRFLSARRVWNTEIAHMRHNKLRVSTFWCCLDSWVMGTWIKKILAPVFFGTTLTVVSAAWTLYSILSYASSHLHWTLAESK